MGNKGKFTEEEQVVLEAAKTILAKKGSPQNYTNKKSYNSDKKYPYRPEAYSFQ